MKFDQNGLICMADANFYLEQFGEKIGCFEELTKLIVQLSELGEVAFEWLVKLQRVACL